MITIISNITVLVQHNVICFGYFIPMSHGVIKKAPQPPSNKSPSVCWLFMLFRLNPPPKQKGGMHTMQLSFPPPPPYYQVFTWFVCCFTRSNLSMFSCSDQIIAENNAFSKKNKCLLSTYCWSVLVLLFCVYVFLRVLFHSSAIMKLRIALYLHMSITSYLTFHQIMWHNKRINRHGLKIRSCCCFFGFQGNYV